MLSRLRIYLKEIQKTLGLALPMILGFIGAMLMFLIDGLMLGHLGVDPLAAYTFGSQIVSIFMVWGFGVCTAQHILGASAFQQKDWNTCGAILKVGILTSVCFSIPCALILQYSKPWITLMGQEPQVVSLSHSYITYTGWSILPTLLYQNFKNFSETQEHPWVTLFYYIPGLIANVFLNWIFIYGNWGAPAMDVTGAGLATLLARIFMLVLFGIYVLRNPNLQLGSSFWKLHIAPPLKTIKHYLSIGIPMGIQTLMEHAMFVIITIFMGWFGAEALSAFNISLRIGSFAFMIPLGLSFAISVRISKAHSDNNHEAVRRISYSALGFIIFLMLCTGTFIVTTRHSIGWSFFDEVNPRTTEAVILAAEFLLITAFYQTFDGIQFTVNGALRGLSDVVWPTAIQLIIYWTIAIPASYMLAFHTSLGSTGLIYGFLIGFSLCSIILIQRLIRRIAPK